MSKYRFYTRFDRPDSPALDFTDSPSLARQEFEPECNINNILAKFKVTGVLVDPTVRSLRTPMFLDCTSIPNLEQYHEMLNNLVEQFDRLPDEVKDVFGGDAHAAMQWFSRASDRQVVELWRNCGLKPSTIAPKAPDVSYISPAAEPPEAAEGGKAAEGDNPTAA